jgi:salicylate hydroxylase
MTPVKGTPHAAQTSNNVVNIAIVGAGPAGLMTALALEHYAPAGRVRITLLDQNASAADYPGVEYGIQKRACVALEKIDKLEQALARANPSIEIAFYNARLDKRFRSIKFDSHHTRSVARQEFLADLDGLLQYTRIQRRHKVTQILGAANRSVTVGGEAGENKNPFEMQFDLLIAADGISSVARRSLWPAESEINDRGFSCIYMLIEGTPYNAPPGFMARANGGRSELIMGSFSTMTLFPLAKGRLALGIGFDHATRQWLWAEHGLAPDAAWPDIAPETKKAIAVRLTKDARSQNDVLVKALDLVPDWNSYKIYLWAMRDTDPLPQPYASSANIVVLGDAAHAMLPTIGMGASLAIEDGEALAVRIAELLGTGVDAEAFRAQLQQQVFEPFTDARFPVWADLVQRARTAAKSNFISVNRRKRFAIGPQIPNALASKVVTRLEWLADRLGI